MPAVTKLVIQAWIELRAGDPEAVSAFTVARSGQRCGASPVQLRRARLVELEGTARSRAEVEALLHASTLVYNPHKERCVVRASPTDPLPGPSDAEYVVVWERDGERRAAVERWWRHETGETIEVREATVWMLRFAAGVDAVAAASELAHLRDGRHGLLCNPWSQSMRAGPSPAELPWIRLEAPP